MKEIEGDHRLSLRRVGYRAAPVLVVERAPRCRVRREWRGGCLSWLGELSLLGEKCEGGDGLEGGVRAFDQGPSPSENGHLGRH